MADIGFEEDAEDADFDDGNGLESFNGDEIGGFDMQSPVAQSQLKSIIERVERLNEDKAAVAADIKEVYAEAKGTGFDTKALRALIKKRAADKAKWEEEQALVELYEAALEMVK